MSENEILARGIVAGMAIVIPFLGITIAKWHSWKAWCKFWKMMHEDLQAQNERLFRGVEGCGGAQMSELKAIQGVINGQQFELYFKSEADKVITELKNEIETQKRLRDMALASVPNALKVAKIIQHNKYKRCLAMAEWCEVTALWCYQAANTLPIGFRATLYGNPVMIEPSRLFKRSARLNNWVNRWRKLAEKFKEAK